MCCHGVGRGVPNAPAASDGAAPRTALKLRKRPSGMASAPGGASALPSIAGYEQLYHAPVRLLSEIVAPVAAAAGGATPLAPLRNGDAVATTGTCVHTAARVRDLPNVLR